MVDESALALVDSARAGEGGGVAWIARMCVFAGFVFSTPAPDAAEEESDEERGAKDAAEDTAGDGSLV